MNLGLRRQRQQQRDEDANVLPLINVVFLLLIFFMLVGRMASLEELEVQPPESVSEDPMAAGDVRVAVAADGSILLGGEAVSADVLLGRIEERLAEEPGMQLSLMGDAAADSRELVTLMERLRATGVERIQLVTVQPP